MTREMLEIEYQTAWETMQEAERSYKMARANFHDVAGLLMEKLMLDNVDVLARLRDADTPTI